MSKILGVHKYSTLISFTTTVLAGAGTHKVDVMWSSSSGTSFATGTARNLIVEEV